MAIPTAIARLFSEGERRRAEPYVERANVRIAMATADIVLAVVKGSEAHAVEIHARPGELTLSCTCSYAAERGVCKHLWASLIVADRADALTALAATAGPRLQAYAVSAAVDTRDVEDDTPPVPSPAPPPSQSWRTVLATSAQQMRSIATPLSGDAAAWPVDRRIVYLLQFGKSFDAGAIMIDVVTERLRRDGEWDTPKGFRAPPEVWFNAPDPRDREIIQMLRGAIPAETWRDESLVMRTRDFALAREAYDTTLRMIAETGRARVVTSGRDALVVDRWDEQPWSFAVEISSDESGRRSVGGVLRRGDERLALDRAIVHVSGLVLSDGVLSPATVGPEFAVLAAMRGAGTLSLPSRELPDLLESLYTLPVAPPIELPADASLNHFHGAPSLRVHIVSEPRRYEGERFIAKATFRYGNVLIAPDLGSAEIFDRNTFTLHHRDRDAEAAALERLTEIGARPEPFVIDRPKRIVPSNQLQAFITRAAAEGWEVEYDGKRYRPPTETYAELRSSGIDWFDLAAGIRYGDADFSLSEIDEMMERGDFGIPLADGTIGIVPRDWLSRWRTIASAGKSAQGEIRFARTQSMLLDALLESMPEVDVDETFAAARAELRGFEAIGPADPPSGFRGTLREYQREGLGWLHFLRRMGLGGCLADDMGLGKTIQVLALLEARRGERATNGPSLVVVPRSLVHNWISEAERFTPGLRVGAVDFTGIDQLDVLVTTYGMLRRDAEALARIPFDYVVLDEAQAIKNATTASAKAARLLNARHRLAVTGTPIENRLEELWSLFEFLNPGMMGSRAGFGRMVKLTRAAGVEGTTEETAAAFMSRALRPVILRRTKERVARELPERTEQTLEVDLEPAQRKFYDEILEQYRGSVLDRVARMGVARSKMHILEALLRLRQAACHPALVDGKRASLPSAKLDALLPSVSEVVAEGHKVLVFSQFTSFLAIVRAELEQAGIAFEYLDGKTRNRRERVEHFQNDPAVGVFLISLKAGGLGLNLTAADYVYLLDPWWNPAVEAQAIDRTHRIGQTRHVIATRIVARNTVEEKILRLQASKRAIADAILSEDQGVLAGIGREELEALLG